MKRVCITRKAPWQVAGYSAVAWKQATPEPRKGRATVVGAFSSKEEQVVSCGATGIRASEGDLVRGQHSKIGQSNRSCSKGH
jgi:hypothetical protein